MLTQHGALPWTCRDIRAVVLRAWGSTLYTGNAHATVGAALLLDLRKKNYPKKLPNANGCFSKMAAPKGLVFLRSKCPYRKLGGAALRFFRTNRSRGKKRVVTNEMKQREVQKPCYS